MKPKPKAERGGLELTKRQFAAKLGVAVQTVNDWLRDRIPHTRRKVSGRVTCFFAPADPKVQEWFAARGLVEYVYMLLPPSKPPPPPAIGDSEREILTALDRARKMEEAAYRLCENVGEDSPLMYQGLQEHYAKMLDSRRKLEKDWAAIQLSHGRVIPTAEHERIWNEGHGRVANELKTFARRVAPLVAKKTERESYAILLREVETCMRHIERKLNEVE
ncbi:MAG: hypothetical protein ABIH03_06350 [Pseudomonadota bacterium]